MHAIHLECYGFHMASNPLPHITAETAALTSKAIEESPLSLAEVSRRTFIPYVSLHRKVHGVAEFTIRDLAAISIAIEKPFNTLVPAGLTKDAA